MSKCIDCFHWQPQKTEAGMARLGFAKCGLEKQPGLTFSCCASACEKFKAQEAKKVEERKAWLKKKGIECS